MLRLLLFRPSPHTISTYSYVDFRGPLGARSHQRPRARASRLLPPINTKRKDAGFNINMKLIAIALTLPTNTNVTAFHSRFPAMTNLRDGSHNHPAAKSGGGAASSPREEHALRLGSHNHPVPNTMESIQERLAAANLVLPPASGPKANYVRTLGLTLSVPRARIVII